MTRVDYLGRETQFVIVDHLIDVATTDAFHNMLYDAALGFTCIAAVGGWRGAVEPIHIYRVASLDDAKRDMIVRFLLNNTGMRDLYVVLPDGEVAGYSRVTKLHGTRDTGWPHN